MLASQGPVGTRGGVVWMRGPCACPGWGATCLLHAVPTGSRCHQDKHKAPTLPHIRPLSLQDPMRSSTFIRGTRSHPHHRATIGTYPSCQRCCAASAAHSGKTQGARPTLPHSTTLAVWVTIIVTSPVYLHRRLPSEPSCCYQRERQLL